MAFRPFVSRDTGAAEALAGRPIDQDASDVDGAEPDDLAGRLLDPRDPEAWASRLVRWLSEPIERARFRTLAANRRTSLKPWSGTAAVIASCTRLGRRAAERSLGRGRLIGTPPGPAPGADGPT